MLSQMYNKYMYIHSTVLFDITFQAVKVYTFTYGTSKVDKDHHVYVFYQI